VRTALPSTRWTWFLRTSEEVPYCPASLPISLL
jgi:hypothetical protein